MADAREWRIDWIQAQLNDWSYCFYRDGERRFCGRASRWIGHDPEAGDHPFETLEDFLSNKREDSRWIDDKLRKKCERQEKELARLREAAKRVEKRYVDSGLIPDDIAGLRVALSETEGE